MPRTSRPRIHDGAGASRSRWRWAGLVVLLLAVAFSIFTSVNVVGPAAVFAVLVAAVAAATDIVRVSRDRHR